MNAFLHFIKVVSALQLALGKGINIFIFLLILCIYIRAWMNPGQDLQQPINQVQELLRVSDIRSKPARQSINEKYTKLSFGWLSFRSLWERHRDLAHRIGNC